MHGWQIFAAGALALLAFGGCKSLEQGAREQHSKSFSCPEERIQVKPRKDLDAYALIFGDDGEPPADVKRDPARLALWKKKKQDSHATWNTSGELFEANGCGHDVIYYCTHPNGHRGGSNLAAASCSATHHQPKGK